MYQPNPVDTRDITLPESLEPLIEQIACNVHDIWAAGRLAEGWRWGEKRDDQTKTTPCLVPYAELPESEKAYDRNSAVETLKLIVKLGYTIC